MLTSKQRAFLRKKAHPLDPIFQVGKNGATAEVVDAVSDALEARELIKVNVLKNCLEDVAYVADIIAERSHSEVVQVMGRKITLFRQRKKDSDIVLPR